ncbi:MAG: TonB-dependent receptor [bacterium]
MKFRILYVFLIWNLFVCPVVFAVNDIETEPLVFTAERIPIPESSVAGNVTVITREDIELSGAQSIGELLQDYAGITFQQSGAPGKLNDVRIRGSKSSHVLQLVDGYRINNPAMGAADLSAISLDDIERIELVRGGVSSLYGSEGMNGVINIITRKPAGKPKVKMKEAFGTYSTSDVSVDSDGKIGDAGFRFFMNDVKSDGLRSNDDYSRKTLSAGLSADDENLHYDLNLRWIEANNGLSIDYGETLDLDNRQNDHLFFGSLSVDKKWNDARKLAVRFYGTSNTSAYIAPEVFPADSLARVKTSGIDVQYNFRLNIPHHEQRALDMVVGAQYERIRGSNESFNWTTFTPDAVSRNWHYNALFINALIPLKTGLNIAAGARLDDFSEFGNELNPKITLTKFNDKFTAAVSWGKNFHTPTFNDLYWPGIGNSVLNPERSTNKEINIRFNLSPSLRFDLSGFSYRYNSLISWAPDPADPSGFTWRPFNVSRARIAGAEAGIRYYPGGNVEYSLNYTHLDSRNYGTNPSLPGVEHEVNRAPSDQIGLSVSFRGGSRWSWSFRGRHVSSIVDRPTDTNGDFVNDWFIGVDGYTVFDGKLEFRKSARLSYFLDAGNLLDNDYEMIYGYPAPGLSLRLGVKHDL